MNIRSGNKACPGWNRSS